MTLGIQKNPSSPIPIMYLVSSSSYHPYTIILSTFIKFVYFVFVCLCVCKYVQVCMYNYII